MIKGIVVIEAGCCVCCGTHIDDVDHLFLCEKCAADIASKNDLVSRQEAMDAILHNEEVYSNNFGDDPIDRYTVAIIDNDAQTIAQLQPAKPEPIRIDVDVTAPIKVTATGLGREIYSIVYPET